MIMNFEINKQNQNFQNSKLENNTKELSFLEDFGT